MKIAVMGYGTIGSGVVEVFRNQQGKNRKESRRANRGQVCA